LVEAQYEETVIDGRYRLGRVIHRSTTSIVREATHRNGSIAWLKMPLSAEGAPGIAIEASLGNTIGSALALRDDGTTPEGLPYLVIDPPDAATFAELRRRGREAGGKGARMPLSRAMALGDALAALVVSLHELGYATAGLADDEILVLASGEVALLGLDRVVEATSATLASDRRDVVRVLTALLDDCVEARPGSKSKARVAEVIASGHVDVIGLRLAWQAAANAPIATVVRAKSPSLAALDTPIDAIRPTPLAVSLPTPRTPMQPIVPAVPAEGSMIAYLRGPSVDGPPSSASLRPRGGEVYDPLARIPELPRMVRPERHAERSSRRGLFAMGAIASLAAVAVVGVALSSGVTSASGSQAIGAGARAAAMAATDTTAPGAGTASAVSTSDGRGANAAPAPTVITISAPEPADDTLELDDDGKRATATNASGAGTTGQAAQAGQGLLRTEGAPPGRRVLLDGVVVGETPLAAKVACGRRTLHMASGRSSHVIQIPCDGERVVVFDTAGHWTVR